MVAHFSSSHIIFYNSLQLNHFSHFESCEEDFVYSEPIFLSRPHPKADFLSLFLKKKRLSEFSHLLFSLDVCVFWIGSGFCIYYFFRFGVYEYANWSYTSFIYPFSCQIALSVLSFLILYVSLFFRQKARSHNSPSIGIERQWISAHEKEKKKIVWKSQKKKNLTERTRNKERK